MVSEVMAGIYCTRDISGSEYHERKYHIQPTLTRKREFVQNPLNRGSYMSAHVLLNLLNKLGKRDKMRGLPSILSLFRNEFNKFNNTGAPMLDSIYHMTLKLF